MKDEKQDAPEEEAGPDSYRTIMSGTVMYGGIGIIAGYLGSITIMVIFGILAILRVSPVLWETLTSKIKTNKG